ncbi:unnamed protein product, partial [Sphacelaria rigidula]
LTRSGGEWEQALALLREMRTVGITPDVMTYSAAISACGHSKRWEEA